MSMQEQLNVAAHTVEQAPLSTYENLCSMVDIAPVGDEIKLDTFRDAGNLAETRANERLTAAINVFLDMAGMSGEEVTRIDKLLLDDYIAKVDTIISQQLDQILHHPDFQKVESAWRSLRYLINRTPNNANIKIEMLDVDKETLRDDFEEAPDTTQSALYKHVYTSDYDTPGGEPVSTMVSNFEFDCSAPDVSLLQEISRVSAAAHCPFMGSVGPKFFLKESLDEVSKIQDIGSYMERAEFLRWKNFRESEDSRYIGLAFPRFLLRLPYGETNPIRNFNYQEDVNSQHHERYLWGNATFAFAANIIRSFHDNGWSVNIRVRNQVVKLKIYHCTHLKQVKALKLKSLQKCLSQRPKSLSLLTKALFLLAITKTLTLRVSSRQIVPRSRKYLKQLKQLQTPVLTRVYLISS